MSWIGPNGGSHTQDGLSARKPAHQRERPRQFGRASRETRGWKYPASVASLADCTVRSTSPPVSRLPPHLHPSASIESDSSKRVPSRQALWHPLGVTRRFAFLLVWLALTAEVKPTIFQGKWETPLTTLGTAIFTGLPGVHFPLWDLMVFATTAVALAQAGARKGRVAPLLRSIHFTLGSLAAAWIWGVVLQGGSAYQTMFQLHQFVVGMVVAYMLMATCRTMRHIEGLGKVVLFATIYRAFVLLIFYVLVARHLETELNALTEHQDTALFVTGLILLLAHAAHRRSIRSALWASVAAVPVVLAIYLNSRRLAWVAVVAGLGLIYALLPKDQFKRRMNTFIWSISPLLLGYVAIGWGQPTGIFKPVGSISTMFGEHQDTSSVMRDIENYNLTKTLKSNPLLGLGWGHEYFELVAAYRISGGFPQYRYMPHNSLLGVLAFSGMLGFIGTCQIFPVAAFLHMRAYLAARTPAARTGALVGIVAIMVCVLEMWGDLGFNGGTTNVVVGASLAVAGRLPALVGGWAAPQSTEPGHNV